MSVRDHLQSFYLSAGNYGCYAICIALLAKKILEQNGKKEESDKISIENALISGIEKGHIIFNEKYYSARTNFYVLRPNSFLSDIVGCRYDVKRVETDYQLKSGEYEIYFWATSQKNADAGIGHFTLPECDTLQNSNTVAQGKVYSKRIFYKI